MNYLNDFCSSCMIDYSFSRRGTGGKPGTEGKTVTPRILLENAN